MGCFDSNNHHDSGVFGAIPEDVRIRSLLYHIQLSTTIDITLILHLQRKKTFYILSLLLFFCCTLMSFLGMKVSRVPLPFLCQLYCSKQLLSRLVELSCFADPQVALILLWMCGGCCNLIHLARATPPCRS